MKTKEKHSLDILSYMPAMHLRIWIGTGDRQWLYDSTGELESHDPMDRVGGPFRISHFLNDEQSCGDKFFLFVVADCAFPIYDLVLSSSWESAYEAYIDWAAEHRHMKIEESYYADYNVESDSPTCQFTSDGVPVDTDDLRGDELPLIRIELIP